MKRYFLICVFVCSCLVLSSCIVGDDDTYQNFVKCKEKRFIVKDANLEMYGDVELRWSNEGTKDEWRYYVLKTSNSELKLEGGSPTGSPNYDYGNISFAPLINSKIQIKGVQTFFQPFKNDTDENLRQSTEDGIVVTEIDGYRPLCCRARVTEEEAYVYEEEIRNLDEKIRLAEDGEYLSGSHLCTENEAISVCSKRLISIYRRQLKRFVYMVQNGYSDVDSCFWAR